MLIYMDVCCLNRPFDDISQDRIYFEAEAVLSIIARCKNDWKLISSNVINNELAKLPNTDKLNKVQDLYSIANEYVPLTRQAQALAKTYQYHGIKFIDSLHLAIAETALADIFLTTDDKFLRVAQTLPLHTKASNPVTWLMEVLDNE